MPICSYLIFPAEGQGESLCRRLNEIPGCEAVSAENDDLLILVTETDSAEEDQALREVVKELDEIRTIVLVFGEIEAVHTGRRGRVELSRTPSGRDGYPLEPTADPAADAARNHP